DGQRGLHQMHDAIKVWCELLLDLGGRHLLEISEQAVASVVDQNINPSETLDRLVDSSFGLCLAGDIQLHKSDAPRCNARIAATHFFEISAGRNDALARAQRRLGNSFSDATARTCDKPDFAHHN